MNGKIYKITNRITNKVYIGLTTREIETRFEEHCYKSGFINNHLYYSMRKHGTENFTIELIEDDIKTIEELSDKEIKYIEVYNSFNDGYNLTLGGAGANGSGKAVIQMDKITGEIIEVYATLKDASEQTGANYTSISNVCYGLEKSCGGFIWCYEKDFKHYEFKKYEDNRTKGIQVVQRRMDTKEIVGVYKTMVEASKQTGIILSGISEACNGNQRSAGGYIWTK